MDQVRIVKFPDLKNNGVKILKHVSNESLKRFNYFLIIRDINIDGGNQKFFNNKGHVRHVGFMSLTYTWSHYVYGFEYDEDITMWLLKWKL